MSIGVITPVCNQEEQLRIVACPIDIDLEEFEGGGGDRGWVNLL